MAKKIILSTTNDISTDNRVHKVAMLLMQLGFDVHWVGRALPNSLPLDRPYRTSRMRLFFAKGGLFYAEFHVRLFLFLLRHRGAVLVSNDLDTLLPNYLASRLYKTALVYDSHEYFCGVPEIQGRWVKKLWLAVERAIFPRLKHIWTVNESIADLYEKDYGIRPSVFRNISPKPSAFAPKSRAALNLPENRRIVINQGSGMNVDRGLEEAVEAVAGMDGWLLLLVGSGDAIPGLKEKVQREGWQEKVLFIDRMPYDQLLHYTATADVGLSLDKDSNINYRFSLPNKLFDYIHCSTPVVTSRVVEVKRIVEEYNVGLTVHVENILALQRSIAAVAEHSDAYAPGLKRAQEELSWERESMPLKNFYGQFL
jgi:glycosyltransferase involved in cell wall biosynthesis